MNHCKEMQRQFLAAGVICELHTYQNGDKEREINMQEFRKPDSYIRGLISVSALSRGLDVPDVSVIIMCRPLRKAFSEFIQVIGRGLRPYPGKQFCTILDHSGNYARFFGRMQHFFAEGVHELDNGEKKDKEKKPKEDAEKPPAKCPKCYHVHKPAKICPACGHEYPSRSEVIHESGELMEISAPKVKMNTADKARLFAELKYIANERQWGWNVLCHRFRDITGVWPNAYKDVDPIEATQATCNKVKQLQIAWLKSKKYEEWKSKKTSAFVNS